jgi:hypothetical protein
MENQIMFDRSYFSRYLRSLIQRLQGNAVTKSSTLCQLVPSPDLSSFSLGNILMASGQITVQQLQDALEQQKRSDKKIGELLVENGCLKQSEVDQGLHLQYVLVSAALGTVIALYPPVTVEAGNQQSAGFRASASVRRVSRITILHQQQEMVITAQDIANGYLDLPDASSVEVKNSSPAGYMLAFDVGGGPFRQIYVRGLKNELQISFDRGWVIMPYSRTPEQLVLTYRFMLAADTTPGIYPFPVQITASAI